MKKSVSILITFCLLACSSPSMKNKKVNEVEIKESTEFPKSVNISIEEISGIWQCKEIRILPNEVGTAPMGGIILLGITPDFKLAFATESIEELNENLDFIPSEFKIENNQICAVDLNDFTFKSMLQRPCVSVYLLNDKEMVIGKGKDPYNPEKPAVYHYYCRVK